MPNQCVKTMSVLPILDILSDDNAFFTRTLIIKTQTERVREKS